MSFAKSSVSMLNTRVQRWKVASGARSKPAPGPQEVRPGYGPRLVAPGLVAIGLGVLAIGTSGWVQIAAAVGFLVAAVLWANLVFRHRVNWEGQDITLFDLTLSRHIRPRTALIDIRPHAHRAGYEMIFKDRQPLYVPAYLALRGRFLSAMQDIIHINTNNGCIQPMEELRERIKG